MMPRSLKEWAQLSEITASIAVVLSLLYVGYEVRQNRIALQATSRQQFAAHDLAYLATDLDPAVLAAAASKLEEGELLTPLEHSQLVRRQHMNFRIFENAYYQYRKGTLELPEWGRYHFILEVRLCEDEAAQTMWTRFHRTFVPEFRDEVEAIRRRCS